jgi:prephenate dehydrogenase
MPPVVAIIGRAGAYGRWLSVFFAEVMGCKIIGTDPQLAHAPTVADLVAAADVLVFSTPIRQAPAIIAEYVAAAGARSRDQLWLDVTSIKTPAVQAMLTSEADVVGLHPMCAAPKTRTLRDRVLVVCEARLQRWRPWLQQLLQAFDAQTVHCTPAEHDQLMAIVQGLVHAGHLAQGAVIARQPAALATLTALWPYRSPSFALDMTVLARILTSNPTIYEDIQFLNPYLPAVLQQLAQALQDMAAQVSAGSDAARAQWRQQWLDTPRLQLGESALQQGYERFDQLAYLLADLDEPNVVVLHLPRDEPGQLGMLLAAFADAGINLQSLHSSRDQRGELHFRLGLDRSAEAPAVFAVLQCLQDSGTARVIATR